MGSELQRAEQRCLIGELSVTIDSRCKEQRDVVGMMLMDFKDTAPGSKEQVQALSALSFLLGMWVDFLEAEERRMKLASTLDSTSSF